MTLQQEVAYVLMQDRLVELGYPSGRYTLWVHFGGRRASVWGSDFPREVVDLEFTLPQDQITFVVTLP